MRVILWNNIVCQWAKHQNLKGIGIFSFTHHKKLRDPEHAKSEKLSPKVGRHFISYLNSTIFTKSKEMLLKEAFSPTAIF